MPGDTGRLVSKPCTCYPGAQTLTATEKSAESPAEQYDNRGVCEGGPGRRWMGWGLGEGFPKRPCLSGVLEHTVKSLRRVGGSPAHIV